MRRDVCENALEAIHLIHAGKGHEVSFLQMNALRTHFHEALHGSSPVLRDGAYRNVGKTIEEGTTEILARKVIRERFGFDHPTLEVQKQGVYKEDVIRLRNIVTAALQCTPDEAAAALEEASLAIKRTPKLALNPRSVAVESPEDYARIFARSVRIPNQTLLGVPEHSRPEFIAKFQARLHRRILSLGAKPGRRDSAMDEITPLEDELSLIWLDRNDPEATLSLLKKRHEHRLLRDEDIKIALKLQDDRTWLSAAIRAAGLKPNDPTDDW
ncbi:MAG: hypothetical protein U0325_30725 [Polyangiales bacterium]